MRQETSIDWALRALLLRLSQYCCLPSVLPSIAHPEMPIWDLYSSSNFTVGSFLRLPNCLNHLKLHQGHHQLVWQLCTDLKKLSLLPDGRSRKRVECSVNWVLAFSHPWLLLPSHSGPTCIWYNCIWWSRTPWNFRYNNTHSLSVYNF